MKFDEWFEAQFGKDPYPGLSLPDLYSKIDSLRLVLRETEGQIKAREKRIDQRTAALYAWNIKEKDKQ